MNRLAAAVAVALLLALTTSCGGGGGSDEDPTLDAPAAYRDAAAVVKDANLRAADFPDEWRSNPPAPNAASVSMENDNAFADCMGRPRPAEIRVTTANSEDFYAQDTRRASSSVQVVKSEAIAKDDFVALRGDKAMTCFKAQIDAEFVRQNGPTSAPQTSVERLDLPQFGDESVAFRVQATTSAGGAQVRTYIDEVFIRRGATELSAAFINQNTPFPTDLERSLLQKMVGRA